MLDIVLGPTYTDKTEYIMNSLSRRLEKGEYSYVLVPEQFSLFTEKEIIKRFGLPAQKQIKVLSFSRLCNMVLQKVGPLRMKYVDGAGKHIIAAQVLAASEGKVSHLKHNLKQKGFAQILTDTISECKRYGVSPQILRFASDNTKNEELSQKIDEIAFLYEKFNEILEQNMSDAEDNLSIIYPKIKDCSFLKGKIYIWHFRSFTPVEFKAIGELMKLMDMCVTLDYSDLPSYGSLFNPVEKTMRRLCETVEEIGIPKPEIIKMESQSEKSSLGKLRERYFDYRAEKVNDIQDEIEIYELASPRREIECVADLILKLCRTKGYRFKDFLVLSRDTSRYARILPSVLESRGVKVFVDAKQSITSKPLVKLLLGTLEILAYGHSYERVMSIARGEIFDIPREKIDSFENYILATAPTHKMWQTKEWDYLPDKLNFDLDEINQTKNILLSGVDSIQNKLVGRKTGAEIATAILDWLKESQLAERISQISEFAIQRGDRELAEEYQQVWNITLSILAQMSAIMGDSQVTYRRFFELFEETCQGTEIGMVPQTLDCVMFSQIDRFRSSGAKVVLVLDMNEGSFPKGYNSEGFLSDAERYSLEKIGIELAPGLESKRREEQLLIYAVLSAPREKLIFLRSMYDNEGNLKQQSSILKRVCELFPHIEKINPDTGDDILKGTEGVLGAFELLSTLLADCGGDAERLTPPLKELYDWFSKDESSKEKIEKLYRAMNSVPPEELSKEMVEKIYGETLSLSASQLEVYNSCAFKYFLTYGLKLREREIAGIESRNMGTIQHDALYRYFTDIKKNDVDFSTITRDDCFEKIGAVVEKVAKEKSSLLYESSAYYQYIVMRMKDISARTAWEVVKFYKSSKFRPYGLELKIGMDGFLPALSVKSLEGREIARIRGMIDRADTTEQNGKTLVSIVDYKSSSKNLDITLAKDGIVLQPLLYSSALCNSIENSAPAAMFYFQMNDPIIAESEIKGDLELAVDKKMKPKGWIVDDAEVLGAYSVDGSDIFIPKEQTTMISAKELEERVEAANRKIRESAMDILDGKIGAHPYQTYKHDACEYCEYHGICQK